MNNNKERIHLKTIQQNTQEFHKVQGCLNSFFLHIHFNAFVFKFINQQDNRLIVYISSLQMFVSPLCNVYVNLEWAVWWPKCFITVSDIEEACGVVLFTTFYFPTYFCVFISNEVFCYCRFFIANVTCADVNTVFLCSLPSSCLREPPLPYTHMCNLPFSLPV